MYGLDNILTVTILINVKGNIQNKPYINFKGLPVYESNQFIYDLEDKMYIYRPLKIEDIIESREREECAFDKDSLNKHQDDIFAAQYNINVKKTKKCNAGQVSVLIDEDNQYYE